MNFSELALSSNILDAVKDKGYSKASPIQAQAIPAILSKRDVMAAAQTGTGKTAGFTLPILELLSNGEAVRRKRIRALIVTPTRELAAQVHSNVCDYGKNLDLSAEVVFGGVKINPQIRKLEQGVDILVATPGRLLDLQQQQALLFDQVEILVLDEADRMLDMGFIHDIKRLLKLLPRKRQNLMFSATFSDEIKTLAKTLVNDPLEISVTPPNSTVESVEHCIHPVDKKQKAALLIHLLQENKWQQVLVFSRTKHGANKLTRQLEKEKISAAAIHGNKSQSARTKALAQFKANKLQVLVATDIAARGIDINQLPYVINFDLPNVPEDYVHRIGRTGRAGAKGNAISLVCADEIKQLNDIERVIKQNITRILIDGFEPVHDLPASKPPGKTHKPKKNFHKGAKSGNPSQANRNRNESKNKTAKKKKPHSSSHSSPSTRSNSKSNASNKKRANFKRPRRPAP
jgi:ATP-dependent RNA helicase RhlE